MMMKRRFLDRLSILVLVIGISLMGIGFVLAQSQDATNARVDERINSSNRRQDDVEKRIDRIETALMYGMAGLAANLVAHLLQIKTQVRARKPDEDGS